MTDIVATIATLRAQVFDSVRSNEHVIALLQDEETQAAQQASPASDESHDFHQQHH